MKVLVTGGAGFIGKHLVRSLLERKHTVTIFDNFSNSTKDSVSSLVDIGAKVIEGDITKPLEILNAIKDQDIVIHLAAKISVSESTRNPSETFRVNVDGTRNVLVACEKNHVKKLIAASSAAVYGEGSSNVNLTERTKTNPISPYGESKVEMEQVIEKFVVGNNINCTILRFFNIYGTGQLEEYAGVISKFIENTNQEKIIEIFGDGLQTRDFVSVIDIVDVIEKAILWVENKKFRIFNIGSGQITTIKELADLIISISGKKNNIKFSNEKKGDIKFSQADINLARKELDYSPKFKLKEGISEMINIL